MWLIISGAAWLGAAALAEWADRTRILVAVAALALMVAGILRVS